jgi:hypothetical protein
MTESVREAICCVSMYGTTSSGALSQSCGCVWSMVRYGCVWRDTGASGNLRARLAPYGRVLAPYGRVLAPYGRCWRPTGVCRRPTGAKTNALTPVSATGCFFQVGRSPLFMALESPVESQTFEATKPPCQPVWGRTTTTGTEGEVCCVGFSSTQGDFGEALINESESKKKGE